MSNIEYPMLNAQVEPPTRGVRVEVMSWLRRYFDAEGSERVVMEKWVPDGMSVRELVEEIAARNRALGELLFDPETGRWTGHVSLILNGRFLELSGGLEARLRDGDVLRVMPVFAGG